MGFVKGQKLYRKSGKMENTIIFKKQLGLSDFQSAIPTPLRNHIFGGSYFLGGSPFFRGWDGVRLSSDAERDLRSQPTT
jgi:hypothetical protein